LTNWLIAGRGSSPKIDAPVTYQKSFRFGIAFSQKFPSMPSPATIGRLIPPLRICFVADAPPGLNEQRMTESALLVDRIRVTCVWIDGSMFENVSLPAIDPLPASWFQRSSK